MPGSRFICSLFHRQFSKIILGGLCYYAALPPLGLFPLAFLTPFFWACVITNPEKIKKRYVYFTAILFWLASIWWIACPHPLTLLGLSALAAFLSLYWVLFFVSAHIAVHRFRISVTLAVPICWIGCEYLRCRIFGGFSFCAIEHSFYRMAILIQLAGIGGQYLVGGFIMAIGAALLKKDGIGIKKTGIALKCPGILAAVMLFYGAASLITVEQRINNVKDKPPFHQIVALQGDIPVSLNSESGFGEKTFRRFLDLTYQKINEHKEMSNALPELIIFPETVCPIPVLEFTGAIKPAGVNLSEEETVDGYRQLQNFVNHIQTPALIGLSAFSFEDTAEPQRLNAALLLHPVSEAASSGTLPYNFRYDKIHLVMFGEYIPFSQYLPDNFIIKTLCQEAGRGKIPVAMPVGSGITASVNICFESTVPHFIRSQVLSLRKQGSAPNLLINISNDGWFRFSQQIDQHLATHIFRAVENGMWYVTATNGGFSAVISPGGTIEAIGKRGRAEAVEGTVYPEVNYPPTVYQYIGDWYALLCAVLTTAFLLSAPFMQSKQHLRNRHLRTQR
ncbi:MAG: apolipoprotein N-acyltransferase [Planctomycetaceae bacterium]|jgi:apolipoprotein N-acyltransferase|nr:apolipoprotein N-acyltransferase [Planctomycetaceae bacterium]